MVRLCPSFFKNGGDSVTDYELIMIMLSLMSLVSGLLVALYTKDKK